MYIPKPCAASSVNLTSLDYFYGQFYSSYDIKKDNAQKVLSRMTTEKELVFQNGTDSKNFAWMGKPG